MTAATCPCCGQSVDPTAVIIDPERRELTRNGVTISLRPQWLRIISTLLRCAPGPASTWDLVDAAIVAGAPARDPKGADKLVPVAIHHLRKRIEPLGLRIIQRQGTGYFLEDAERRSVLMPISREAAA